jgi:hypothetical protein
MYRKLLFAFGVCLVLALLILPAFPQDKETGPQLVFVRETVIKPDMDAKFRGLLKEAVAMAEEYTLTYPFFTTIDGNFHYIIYYPIKGRNDIVPLFEAWNEIAKQRGDGYSEMWKGIWECTDYIKDYFMWYLPKYSYTPENSRLKDDEMNFGIWDMMYIKPDRQKEFYDMIEELLALAKSKNITEAIHSYSGSWGMKIPVHIGVVMGKNPADFWDANGKMWEALGEEAGPLWRKMMSLIKKREFRQWWYLKNLSYEPKD